ncbi:MAG: sigma 54-interacting transcriptional regulator [Angelakisella sp.]|nr:sigma 54-interacting transcriptional regulator [Angelakisella sp.]
MIKILLIVPYKELQARFEEYISKIEMQDVLVEITHIYGTNEEMVQNCKTYNIIIARGITGQAIHQALPEIHFVEIPVTSDDIINALVECRRRGGKREIALVLPGTNICRTGQLEEISGIPIRPYYISTENDAQTVVEDIHAKGIQSIIGGLTVCRLCERLGLHAVQIRTGEEAIERAVSEALNTARSLNLERTRTNLLRTLLNNSKDAIVAVDRDGNVIVMNSQAYRTFHISGQPGDKYHIQQLLNDSDWIETMQTKEESQQLKTIDDKLMLVSRAPIVVDSQEAGVLLTFQNAEEIREAESRIRKQLRGKGLAARYHFDNILAQNPVMLQWIATAYKYSKVDSNVLVMGETGTGKELFAQSIHNASNRASQPFVAINCAALPEQLLESELFGYTEGSFSGASKGGKIGLFEQAHKGTIFLDEIGEMPITLQAKLLRVLQEKEIRRIGDNKVVPVDVRIISATNINIREKLKNGQFRPDLFYRINLLSIRIPPLRERPEDIEGIFRYFLELNSRSVGVPEPEVTDDAMELLRKYPWPGNVRELKNFSERAVVLGGGGIIDEAAIFAAGLYDESMASPAQPEPTSGFSTGFTPGFTPGLSEGNTLSEEDRLLMAFAKGSISKTELAKRLGISRTTLWRKLKAYEEKL